MLFPVIAAIIAMIWKAALMMSDACYDLSNLEQSCFLDDPGGGAFASCFGPTSGHLTDLFVPTPGNLPFKKKMLMPGGWPGGDGH